MITLDLTHAETLEQFYSEIRTAHKTAHGDLYVAHHDRIAELAADCESYRELGVMQGATAACVALAGVRNIHLVDIVLDRFKPYQHLFESHTDTLTLYEGSSTNPLSSSSVVDMMLIDTLHKPEHVRAELVTHASNVNKYIVFHDTTAVKSLQREVDSFVTFNRSWRLVEHFTQNVGYSLIERIS